MSKLNRSNYLKTGDSTYGKEKILTSNDFTKYNFVYPVSFYKIVADDIGRPDLIAIKVYGTQDFWWMLMKYNGIDDIWNELYKGQTIRIPDIRDFNQYANRYGE